uniref:RNA-directed DNA polymerase n=1 Tax=Rhipicephalus zambeziensis TaxID=60191 RepID=A0A224YP72_9ACAR
MLAGTSDSPTHTGDCDSSVPHSSSMTSAIPPSPFLQTPGTPPVPWAKWRRVFQAYVDVAAGDTARPALKSLLLNALGVEGLDVYWKNAQEQAESGDGTRDEGTQDEYVAALTLLENHFKAPSNEVLERHYFKMRKQIPGESVTDYVSALQTMASKCNFGASANTMVRDQLFSGITAPHVRRRLLQLGPTLTLQQAIQIAKEEERTELEMHEFANAQVDKIEFHPGPQDGRQNTSTSTYPKQKNHGRRPPRPNSGGSQHGRGHHDARPPPSSNFPSHQDGPYRPESGVCYRCGSSQHYANFPNCPARNRICSACGKRGHFRGVCRSSNVRTSQQNVAQVQDTAVTNTVTILNVDERSSHPSPLKISVQVGQVNIPFLVDTGATVSLLNLEDFKHYFQGTRLLDSYIVLQDYSKKCIPNVGYFSTNVRYNDTTAAVTFYVTKEGSSLLYLDAIRSLHITIDGATLSCSQVSSTENRRIPSNAPSEFHHLFTQELGLVKGYMHEVKRRPGIQPVAAKLRRLPFLLQQQVSDELSRLEKSGVIERVSASDWVSPLVVVKKKNGSLRLCVDLREPNKAIVVDGFPLPHIEELLQQLTGAVYFSKLDLASAYHQVNLSEPSRDLTTFVTHDGLFRFRRVCFGLASAPAVFQKMMSDILKDCSGVLCYLDDILVWGRTRAEHDANLQVVLSRISNTGMKLNDKCVFAVQQIQFLGHNVSARGLSPLESKVHAIVNAPAPADCKSLHSFLGLAGYYSKFIPHYADVVEPLRSMLRKGQTFNWSNEANSAFNIIKEVLAANPVIQLFDEKLPIVITTDASNIGLGAVFQQRKGDQLVTIAFASRTLSPAERRYSAGEREALACLFACEKWHVYLWGRHFTLRTDHQALVTLLSAGSEGRRPLRISRWCARLLYYNFTVQYCKGSHNVVADALSRLPLQLPVSPELEEEIISLVTPCITKPELQAATAADTTLQQVLPYIANGWPEKKSLPPELLPYFAVRTELSCVDNLIFRADRISIPTTMCDRLVQLAHESHPGIVRTKQRLRERYWWPGLDSQVERAVRNCIVCQTADKSAKPVFYKIFSTLCAKLSCAPKHFTSLLVLPYTKVSVPCNCIISIHRTTIVYCGASSV